MSTLTSANSVLALSIAGLYPVPQIIQGYATDDAFAFPDVKSAETMMGVDGFLSGGYTPYPTIQEISLQADSVSNLIFDTWLSAQNTAREIYIANATIIYPSLSSIFTFTRGIMTSNSPLPTAKAILQPRRYQITWQNVSRAPYSGS